MGRGFRHDPWGGTHVALMRGNGDSSWVLHWHEGEAARIWHAKPLSDVGNAAWPVPITSYRTFCAGHSALADGRLLVVGGTAKAETEVGKASIFDARSYGQQPGYGW